MIKLVNIKPGEVVLFYIDGKVMLVKEYVTAAKVYTHWDSFTGSQGEIDAKIIELNLT